MTRRIGSALAFSGALFVLATALAVEPGKPSKLDATGTDRFGTCESGYGVEGPAALPVAVAGVRVAIDPRTGRLVPPSPGQVEELTEALLRNFASRGPRREPVRHADGMLSMIVDESHFHHSVARIDDDGRLALECPDPGTEISE